MRVLLVGEGRHELLTDARVTDSGASPPTGALANLVRRLAGVPLEIEQAKVSRADLHTHRGKGQGFFKRAVRWILDAEKNKYDALVLVIDEDHRAERIKEMAEAQAYAGSSLRRALGVAVHTFDAWILADEAALSNVLQRVIACQPAPESIDDAKGACRKLLEESAATMAQAEMYAAVAAILNVGLLERRCPAGFAPFAERVRALG